MIPRIKFDLRWLLRVMHPTHGPQTWAWWRPFSLSVVRLGVEKPSRGYRLWIYSRWGAVSADMYFDRRTGR